MRARRTPDESRDTNGRWRMTLPLRWLLAIAFGGLVALSVGIVLALTVRTNFVNTFSLLNTRAIELIEGMENQLHDEARSAERVVGTVSQLYASGKITMQDTPERRAVIETLLRTVPSVEGIFLFDRENLSGALFRRPEGAVGDPPAELLVPDLRKLLSVDAAIAAVEPKWSDPAEIGRIVFQNVSIGLRHDGEREGVVVALIGQHTVNRIVAKLGRESDATVFMLAGPNLVVSHSGLPQEFRSKHAIPLAEFPDEVLRELSDAAEEEDFSRANRSGVRVFVSPGSNGHIFLIKRLAGYSAEPYRLGAYFRKADIGAEILRTMYSLLVGIAGLVAAVIAAIMLGKRISRPMSQIARTATLFSDFRLDEIQPLPRSRIAEVDNQAVALNRMRTTLTQFTRYVPRELVARLMRSGEDANHSVERDMTVMFTDIAGFTGLSERMNAAEVTTLLNHHFEMITHHVEASGGTIDKFMGDGVLAFWGAPEADSEHILHAVRAAEAITRSIHEDNAARTARGEPPLRLRIGIHTGRVVVGNIGGPDRQNYTIVGDAVNVAQRLEQMAREIMDPHDEVVALTSSPVADALEDQASFTPAGTRIVRGRERPIAVCVLNIDGVDAASNVVPFAGSGPT